MPRYIPSIMRTSTFAVLACLGGAIAGPLEQRAPAVTESALNPWVTVVSGTPSTVTPYITTISGVATTVDAVPASLTVTTSFTGTRTTGGATATNAPSTGGGSFEVCHNLDGDFAPFCTPNNGSSVYVDETYYVTWDADYWTSKNTSIIVQANYVNTTLGMQTFESSSIPVGWGFYAMKISSSWLQGYASNNLTLYIVSLDNTDPNAVSQSFTGPTVMATKKPVNYYHQPQAQAPSGASLYIGIPIVVAFVIACLIGVCWWNRKHRQIALGNIMGRNRGYGERKTKRQRLGLGKNKRGVVAEEQELVSEGIYRDAPVREEVFHRRDNEDLGSLVGTPTEERTNYFRDEMRRQEAERRQ